MFKIHRCNLGLHYWLYNPEKRLRVCDACQLKQVKTKGLLFNSWEIMRRRPAKRSSAPLSVRPA